MAACHLTARRERSSGLTSMSQYADSMSTIVIGEPGPKEAIIDATVSTTCDSEQYCGLTPSLTPSLTLHPGGCDKLVINLHFLE